VIVGVRALPIVEQVAVRIPGVGHAVNAGQTIGGIILVAVYNWLSIYHRLFRQPVAGGIVFVSKGISVIITGICEPVQRIVGVGRTLCNMIMFYFTRYYASSRTAPGRRDPYGIVGKMHDFRSKGRQKLLMLMSQMTERLQVLILQITLPLSHYYLFFVQIFDCSKTIPILKVVC